VADASLDREKLMFLYIGAEGRFKSRK